MSPDITMWSRPQWDTLELTSSSHKPHWKLGSNGSFRATFTRPRHTDGRPKFTLGIDMTEKSDAGGIRRATVHLSEEQGRALYEMLRGVYGG